jgi:hypothetical protein
MRESSSVATGEEAGFPYSSRRMHIQSILSNYPLGEGKVFNEQEIIVERDPLSETRRIGNN